MKIPEKIAQFNVYENGKKLVGLSGEITLPKLEAMAETISGAGILGEYDSVAIGHFGPISIELPFLRLYDENFVLMSPGPKHLVLRGAASFLNSETGAHEEEGLKITFKGTPKGLDLGKIGTNKPTETKNTLELMYIKIELGGKVLLELDKTNMIFILNGVDALASIRALI